MREEVVKVMEVDIFEGRTGGGEEETKAELESCLKGISGMIFDDIGWGGFLTDAFPIKS